MAGTLKKLYIADGVDITEPTDLTSSSSAGTSGPIDAMNYGLVTSVATSAMTITLKTLLGSNPSSVDPSIFSFRSATAATGTYVQRSAITTTSLVISSGATLGQLSGVNFYMYIYALDNAGTVELAVSTGKYEDNTIVSTTAMSGSATSSTVIYSTTARTNVAMRLIARIKVNEAAAGTWASNATEITLGHRFVNTSGVVRLSGGNGMGSSSTVIRRFTTADTNTLVGLTYADSASLGTTFTCTIAGVYAFTYVDFGGSSDFFGLSLNSASLTTTIASITASEVIAMALTVGSSAPSCVTAVLPLAVGDVVRPHATAAINGTTAQKVRFIASPVLLSNP